MGERPTETARYKLVEVDLAGAKGTEIVDKFLQSTPFHDGSRPRVVAVHAVQNDTLARLHEEYRSTCGTKTRRNLRCGSCTTARTTKSWRCFTAMGCSRLRICRPRRHARLLVAKACAHRSATTTVSTVSSGTNGTGATCSAW